MNVEEMERRGMNPDGKYSNRLPTFTECLSDCWPRFSLFERIAVVGAICIIVGLTVYGLFGGTL